MIMQINHLNVCKKINSYECTAICVKITYNSFLFYLVNRELFHLPTIYRDTDTLNLHTGTNPSRD